MKKLTLYSLFYTKNMTRLFYFTLMAEYVIFLMWWQNNPQNHLATIALPLAFSACLIISLCLLYHYRFKHEKLQIDENNIYYYKKRYPLNSVTFYPIEQLNNKIYMLAFKVEADKTFMFSTFLQKKKYEKIKSELQLAEYNAD